MGAMKIDLFWWGVKGEMAVGGLAGWKRDVARTAALTMQLNLGSARVRACCFRARRKLRALELLTIQ
jgi:hypothetical protein